MVNLMMYFLFLIGLAILLKGVDLLVDSSAKIAKYFGIPSFIIGLSIVAFGTSAPESAIGIISGINGANQITLGDVIGSSLANIFLIVGLSAIIFPLSVYPLVTRREIPGLFFIQVILTLMIITGNRLSRLEALFLLAGFLAFIIYLIKNAKKIAVDENPSSSEEAALFDLLEKESVIGEEAGDGILTPLPEQDTIRLPFLAGKFFIGLALLVYGGHTVVTYGVAIAAFLGLSEEFIGITVIAIGTSLPELLTSAVAALHREEGIAVGNIIGSNIFNILFVLGISGAIHPIDAHPDVFWDSLAMVASTVFLFIPAYLTGRISRTSGVLFLAAYLVFLALKVFVLFQA